MNKLIGIILFFSMISAQANMCSFSRANYDNFLLKLDKLQLEISEKSTKCMISGSTGLKKMNSFIQKYKDLKVLKKKQIDPIFFRHQNCLKFKSNYQTFFDFNLTSIENHIWIYYRVCSQNSVTIENLKSICSECSYLKQVPIKGFFQ